MNTRYLYTIRWTQPYATEHLRPYLRSLQEQMEQLIESQLDSSDFAEANNIIRRIQNASKSN
jgi:transcriptional regulator GlxA family with amidase domain